MGRVIHKGLFGLIESYYVGSFIYIATVSAIVVWSVILIVGPVPIKSRHVEAKPHLAVSSYQPAPKPAQTAEDQVQPQVLAEETQQPEQPALETWQGPIDPIPDTPGLPTIPIYNIVPTSEPIVFLTIDDGWVQTPEESVWLTQHHLPFTLFLTDNGIKNNYNFFKLLQDAGMSIEDHTISHPDMTRLTLDQQKTEICGSADIFSNAFGNRPTMFRPPYGKANQITIQAASECGMKQIIMWRAVVEKGAIHYQDNNTHLNPGDIVLMHFTKDFSQDIQAFINQANADHLQIANLEDWLP